MSLKVSITGYLWTTIVANFSISYRDCCNIQRFLLNLLRKITTDILAEFFLSWRACLKYGEGIDLKSVMNLFHLLKGKIKSGGRQKPVLADREISQIATKNYWWTLDTNCYKIKKLDTLPFLTCTILCRIPSKYLCGIFYARFFLGKAWISQQ